MLRLSPTGGEPDFETFWRGVGERRGGKVTFFTFATYLGRVPPLPPAAEAAHSAEGALRGRLSGLPLSLPGLLYLVGDRFWFEDFERDNWLLRLIPSKRPFARTEFAFDRSEVTGHRIVSRGSAYRCLAGRMLAEATLPLGRIARFFTAQALQIDLQPQCTLFFEVMRQEELQRLLG